MVRNVEIEKELLDSLIEEACLFVCFYSEGTVDLDKIIKDLLTKLPSLEKSEFCRIRALFFKNLEDQCRQIKKASSATANRQLELFAEVPDQVSKRRQNLTDIGICRARAFLCNPSLSENSFAQYSPLVSDSAFANQVVNFSMQRHLEEIVELDADVNESDFVRCFQVVHYMLELLTEIDAIEVEKKFMQDPVWQSEKKKVSKVLKWFECASQFHDSDHFSFSNSVSHGARSRLLQWIQDSIDRKENEVPLSSPKEDEKHLTDGSHTKDWSLESYLAVGLICLIVGYFGWTERSQKQLVSERFDELIALGTKGAKTFPDMDQASQVAVHKAHLTAASVLAETTKSSIKEMEKQLEVPRHLLISSPVKGTKIPPPEIIEPDTGDQFLKSLIGINKLKKALSAKDGYLFRPGQESMGKIMDIKQGKEGFFLKEPTGLNRVPVLVYQLPIMRSVLVPKKKVLLS